MWRAVLGEWNLAALDDFYAGVVWISDGDLDRLDDAAREYRRIGEVSTIHDQAAPAHRPRRS